LFELSHRCLMIVIIDQQRPDVHCTHMRSRFFPGNRPDAAVNYIQGRPGLFGICLHLRQTVDGTVHLIFQTGQVGDSRVDIVMVSDGFGQFLIQPAGIPLGDGIAQPGHLQAVLTQQQTDVTVNRRNLPFHLFYLIVQPTHASSLCPNALTMIP